MKPLFARLSAETASTYDLVMKSAQIPCQIYQYRGLWAISVSPDHRRSAIEVISLYLKENPVQPEPAHGPRISGFKTYSALYIVFVMALIHWSIIPGYEHRVFVESFGADARRILSGEIYRCVTALWLHKDWPHVVNNMAGMILFGTVAAISSGWGAGWLMILLSGAFGNLLTALWYRQEHLAIGASTAVFGALGLCVAFNLWRHIRERRSPWRMWLPLAGGLALLGFLGGSPHSDLMAHLAGFVCGVVIGGLYGLFCRSPLGAGIQLGAAVTGAVVVALCWVWGIYYSGG